MYVISQVNYSTILPHVFRLKQNSWQETKYIFFHFFIYLISKRNSKVQCSNCWPFYFVIGKVTTNCKFATSPDVLDLNVSSSLKQSSRRLQVCDQSRLRLYWSQFWALYKIIMVTLKGHCHSSFAFFRSYLTGNWNLVLTFTSNKIPDKPKRKLQITLTNYTRKPRIQNFWWFLEYTVSKIFSSFNPFPSSPSLDADEKKWFQYTNMVLVNKTWALFFGFRWCKSVFLAF